jgi:two-component system alkaline phosphatase synthesis response regulator PhoP
MGKILLVDDDQGTTNLLEHILAEDGHQVRSINNCEDTLPAALSYDPNLIVLDLMMPSIDGLEVCRNLRATSQLAHTPIVFFTSASDIEKKVAAFGSGANDYIIKPVYPRELKVRIKALIGNGRNGIHG